VASRDFYRRPFNTFVSYSHADVEQASKLVGWLDRYAGVNAWFDRDRLDGGSPVATTLDRQIRDCRSIIALLTPASLKSDWVPQELSAARGERGRNPAFKTIVLVSSQVEDEQVPDELQSLARVRLGSTGLNAESAARILASLYDGDGQEVSQDEPRDVYITRTWRAGESKATDRLCHLFSRAGFRLIGDMPDQELFNAQRIATVMSTCGAHLAILPNRPDGDEGLRCMLDEVRIARECGLETTAMAHPGLTLSMPAHRIDLDRDGLDARVVEAAIEDLQRRYHPPPRPHFVLFTTSFDDFDDSIRRAMNRVIARVTTRRCVFTDEITGERPMSFTDRVKGAAALIADVADNKLDPWLLAGFARGAATRVHVIARAPRASEPRLFRDRVHYYSNDVERVGLVHRLAFDYRRRLLDFDVADQWSRA